MSNKIQDLITSCDNFSGDSEEFAAIVAAGLETLDVKQVTFATDFQVAISTISRWAAGKNMPHPAVRSFVVDRIAKRAHATANAGKPSGAYGGGTDSGVFPIAAKGQ